MSIPVELAMLLFGLLLAGAAASNVIVLRDAQRNIEELKDRAYHRGWLDHALGRTRANFRPSAKAERADTEKKTPPAAQTAEGK